jgi:hypothetical protein
MSEITNRSQDSGQKKESAQKASKFSLEAQPQDAPRQHVDLSSLLSAIDQPRPQDVLLLQRLVGNSATQRLVISSLNGPLPVQRNTVTLSSGYKVDRHDKHVINIPNNFLKKGDVKVFQTPEDVTIIKSVKVVKTVDGVKEEIEANFGFDPENPEFVRLILGSSAKDVTEVKLKFSIKVKYDPSGGGGASSGGGAASDEAADGGEGEASEKAESTEETQEDTTTEDTSSDTESKRAANKKDADEKNKLKQEIKSLVEPINKGNDLPNIGIIGPWDKDSLEQLKRYLIKLDKENGIVEANRDTIGNEIAAIDHARIQAQKSELGQ